MSVKRSRRKGIARIRTKLRNKRGGMKMKKYEPMYTGHMIDQRKAVLNFELATKEDLALMSDKDVADLINAKFLVFKDGDDFALLPKEYKEKIIWICR